jgi:dihydrofolate reductase
MKRFKQLTTGYTVIMGKKTFESLPGGALPDRTNVVLSYDNQDSFKDCETFYQLSTAIEKHQHEPEVFIIGGASVYVQALGFADKLYITYIHHSFDYADVFFPEIKESEWVLTESEDHPADERHPYPYTFKTFINKKIFNNYNTNV